MVRYTDTTGCRHSKAQWRYVTISSEADELKLARMSPICPYYSLSYVNNGNYAVLLL